MELPARNVVVAEAIFTAPPVPVIVIVLFRTSTVPLPVLERRKVVSALGFVVRPLPAPLSKTPGVDPLPPLSIVASSINVNERDGATVNAGRARPADVSELERSTVTTAVDPAQVVVVDPVSNVISPFKLRLPLPIKLPVNPVAFHAAQAAPVVIVTAPPPELPSKKTLSLVVGAAAPPAPPELRDQLAVAEAS